MNRHAPVKNQYFKSKKLKFPLPYLNASSLLSSEKIDKKRKDILKLKTYGKEE